MNKSALVLVCLVLGLAVLAEARRGKGGGGGRRGNRNEEGVSDEAMLARRLLAKINQICERESRTNPNEGGNRNGKKQRRADMFLECCEEEDKLTCVRSKKFAAGMGLCQGEQLPGFMQRAINKCDNSDEVRSSVEQAKATCCAPLTRPSPRATEAEQLAAGEALKRCFSDQKKEIRKVCTRSEGRQGGRRGGRRGNRRGGRRGGNDE